MNYRIEYYFPSCPSVYFTEGVYVDEELDWELAKVWCVGRGAILNNYYAILKD